MNKEKIIARPLLRIAAYFIDRSITTILLLGMIAVAANSSDPVQLLNSFIILIIAYLLVLQLIWGILLSYLEAKFGGTPGKLLIGIRVVNENNIFISFKRALFRNYIGKAVSGLFLGLGYYWILKDEARQAWHDMVVDTYVVKRSRFALLLGIVLNIIFILTMAFMIRLIFDNVSVNSELYSDIVMSFFEWIQEVIKE